MRRIGLLSLCFALALAGLALGTTRNYSGTTSQKLSGHALGIVLRESGNRITYVGYRANYTCNGPPSLLQGRNTILLGAMKVTHGKFSGTQKPYKNNTDVAKLKGTISGKKITGSFMETASNNAKTTCATGKVTYSAKKQ